ncbi:MAG: stage II sporulation protein R [Clostridiaceae bacterium]
MKKFTLFVFVIIIIVALLPRMANAQDEKVQEDIASKIIRFHVIANSDSVEDQALKIKIKDEVLRYIAPKLENSKDIEESRIILNKYDDDIKAIGENIISENGYSFKINTELSNENFPVKSYGDIILPQGKYEAYRIIIGDGKGQNWWCVMFPPLCFVDITKGEESISKTKEEMKNVLTKEEYEIVNNNDAMGKENHKVIVKFKIVELIKEKINKIL